MKIRTIIVEDEAPSLRRLKALLQEHTDIEIVGEAHDGPEAVSAIDSIQPDLVFLDIQLPVFSGLDVLQHVTHRPKIVFITAYDQYAIRAFEENAVDYLVKPTDPARLTEAIDRVRQLRTAIDDDMIQILRTAVRGNAWIERFSIRNGDEVLLIPASEVCWFHAEDKYVFLHTEDREYIYNATLKELETKLNPSEFIRINKSVIVSINRIQKLSRSFHGQYKVHLKDQQRSSFEIGRTFTVPVRERLHF